jgi:hypothetical protein
MGTSSPIAPAVVRMRSAAAAAIASWKGPVPELGQTSRSVRPAIVAAAMMMKASMGMA